MAMFFLFLGFIALWAITEIIETFLNEKRQHKSRRCQKKNTPLDRLNASEMGKTIR
mgnify:CR=1 FL=1